MLRVSGWSFTKCQTSVSDLGSENKNGVFKRNKTLVTSVNGKEQCAICDNTTHAAEMSNTKSIGAKGLVTLRDNDVLLKLQ